jgi:hypothetical protein
MFAITDTVRTPGGLGFSRREFLRVGSLALGGLGLPQLLEAGGSTGNSIRDKAVVFLFLRGGPPQHETFDPKMGAAAEIRSATGEVTTTLPGVTFGGTFPRLAKLADRLAIVRSFASGFGGHDYEPVISGGGFSATSRGNGRKAAMSAIYARLVGTNHPVSGMPSNVVVLPQAVQETLKQRPAGGTAPLEGLITPGRLGSSYEAFNPAGNAPFKKVMELTLPQQRFDDRRALLNSLDTLRRRVDATGALERADNCQQQAFDVLARGIARAFDLSREDPRTIERYDTSKFFRMEDWTKYLNMAQMTNLLGKQMLLARRLIEHGCGFVTVSDCGWDQHGSDDPNSPKAMTAMEPLGNQVDHAVSAFLEDIRERGLEKRILLIVTGEMGRNPRRNKGGGRDHWGDLTPLLLAGGGLKMGQVIGCSDRDGARAAADPFRPPDLFATVLQFLCNVAQLRLRVDLPRDLQEAIEKGKPFAQLF